MVGDLEIKEFNAKGQRVKGGQGEREIGGFAELYFFDP